MSSSNRLWPPLIVARHVPRLVKWRDILLTSMMWGFLAVLLGTEFELFLGDYLKRLGFVSFDTDANWSVYLDRLMPFLLMAAMLASVLIIFSLRTLQRRSRALLLPQPALLQPPPQAHRAGLDEADGSRRATNGLLSFISIPTEGTVSKRHASDKCFQGGALVHRRLTRRRRGYHSVQVTDFEWCRLRGLNSRPSVYKTQDSRFRLRA